MRAMGKFQEKPAWKQVTIVAAFLLLPVLLSLLGPSFGVEVGGKLSMSRLQSLYAVVSTELAFAVYMWGVGKWSRFHPPSFSSGQTPVPPAQAADKPAK